MEDNMRNERYVRAQAHRYYNRRPSHHRYEASTEQELLARDEVIQVEIVPHHGHGGGDDHWPENTTCVTGNTSERSASLEDLRRPPGTSYYSDASSGALDGGMRCMRFCLLGIATLISVLGYLSPVAMVVLPKVPLFDWPHDECSPDCEGLLLSFAFKLGILALGVWALFCRRSLACLPRLFVFRAFLLALLFLITFAYWLFYGVRILNRRERNYTQIVTFALSLVDALLFMHYLAVILLEIRHLRPEYKLRVIRSPDGVSRTYDIGHLSIQRAAVHVLQNYYTDFPVYNPYLDRLPSTSSRMRKSGGGGGGSRSGGSHVGAPVLKVYDVEGNGNVAPVDPQAVMVAAARARDSAHNERFYEELEWDRRVKKRKARLLTAAEEAFGHVRRLGEEKGPCVPMDPQEAAQAVFPSLSRSLQKYLRITRQQPRHTAEQVVKHLAQCLMFDMSPKAFLERFFSTQETPEASQLNTKWCVVSECCINGSLNHGTVFQLRCNTSGPDAGVLLLVSVTRLPFFNLTEAPISPKKNRFVLRLNSETSV